MEDLKDAVNEAMLAPSGQGTMVQLYGTHLLYPFPPPSIMTSPSHRSREGRRCACAEHLGADRDRVLGHAVQGVSLIRVRRVLFRGIECTLAAGGEMTWRGGVMEE